MIDGLFLLLALLLAKTGKFTWVKKVFLCLETDGVENFIFAFSLALDNFILSVLVWDFVAWEHSDVGRKYLV